jgi:hypothetical protein
MPGCGSPVRLNMLIRDILQFISANLHTGVSCDEIHFTANLKDK